MLKQAACAAAISSSGLVPARPSSLWNRMDVEYGWSFSAPLKVLSLPDPSAPVPFHTALPLRFSISSSPWLSGW
jgi:hypothetical protein